MKAILIPIAAIVAAPALAQTAAPAQAPASTTTVTTTAPDGSGAKSTTTITTSSKGTVVATRAAQPDSKLICQYTETLGSRLGGHKVCKTKQQWREDSMQDRMAIDHAQVSRGIIGN